MSFRGSKGGFSVIYKGSKFEIQKSSNDYYVMVYEKGVDYNEFGKVLMEHNIQLADFNNVMAAFTRDFNKLVYFGKKNNRIVLELTQDEMKAITTFFMDKEELLCKEKIVVELNALLVQQGIVYGIDLSRILNLDNLISNSRYVVAEGDYPVQGEDSTVKLYNFKEVRPAENIDGSVDHYNIGLVNPVQVDEWVGEWSKPTDGVDGVNVKGGKVPARKGRVKKIAYDKKTIREEDMGDRVCLYSKKKGAVSFDSNRVLRITKHLVLDKIDFSTGNIEFDGAVTVKGTIADGFSLVATGDIEILGSEGVGAVNEIISQKGKIAMVGGINGKGKAVIKAINADVKYISNAKVSIKNTLRVQEYILNSTIDSYYIKMEKFNSSISSSTISGVYFVEVGVLGSESESKTIIEVVDIKRESLQKQSEALRQRIEENNISIAKLDEIISHKFVTPDKKSDAKELKSEIIFLNEVLQKDCFDIKRQLSNPFDATIIVKKCIHPGSRIVTGLDVKIINYKLEASRINIKSGEILLTGY